MILCVCGENVSFFRFIVRATVKKNIIESNIFINMSMYCTVIDRFYHVDLLPKQIVKGLEIITKIYKKKKRNSLEM